MSIACFDEMYPWTRIEDFHVPLFGDGGKLVPRLAPRSGGRIAARTSDVPA